MYDYLLSYGKKFADDNELNINTRKTILDQLNKITNGKTNNQKPRPEGQGIKPFRTNKNTLQSNIENYFLEDIGLTIKELELLKGKLTK